MLSLAKLNGLSDLEEKYQLIYGTAWEALNSIQFLRPNSISLKDIHS